MKFNLFQKIGFLLYRRSNLRFWGLWNDRKKWFIFLFFFIVIGIIFIPLAVHAGVWEGIWESVGSGVALLVGHLALLLASLIGKLLSVVIYVLVQVVQYNGFISSTAVSKGWIIIRDLFNMFFVVILLVIAFSAVLKIEKYPYKRMLASFLIAAVLVNFSKLICGILIDFSQILMLTFVNAFKDVAGGNFVDMLGLREIMSLSENVAGEVIGGWEKALTMLLGFIMALVALIVMTVVTLIFVFRIVGIWFLVVLSPLAFMASVLPSTQSYGRQWWQKFTNYLIIGPVLAFFIWLSLAVVQESDGQTLLTTVEMSETVSVGASQIGQPQYMLNFIIGIAMLVASLMVAKQLGVAGAGLAAKAVGKMQGVVTGAVKLGKLPFKGLKYGAKEAVKGTEARLGIPLTGTKIKEMWQERRRQVDIKRRERFEEKREGVVVPRGSELIEYMSLKGAVNLPKVMAQRIFGVAEKRRKKANQIEDDIEKIEAIKQAGTTFTEKDKKEVEDQLGNLRAMIGTLDIDDKARQALLRGIDLTGVDLGDEKQRQSMADKVWNTGSKIKQLRDEEQIARPDAAKPLEQIQDSFSRLAKREMSGDEMKKLAKEQEEMSMQALDLRVSAEMIQPTDMTPEQRDAMNRGVYEEYQKIKPIDDMDELMAMYTRAEKQGRTALAKAVLTKLSEDINLNELQEKLGIEQGWKGMQGVADRLVKKFDMPKQEAYTFMNDIGATNKKRGHFQFMMPFIKDQRTGSLRKVTEEEYGHINNVESGKVTTRTLFGGSWAGIFRKHKDPVMGRVPIYDDTVAVKAARIEGSEQIEYNLKRGYWPEEMIKNYSHKDVIQGLRKYSEQLPASEQPRYNEVVDHFESQQSRYWDKRGAPLRREEPTGPGPAGPDKSQQEIAGNILDAAKANKDIAKLIGKKSPEDALKLGPVAQAVAQHGNIREITRMHAIYRTALLQGMGKMLGGFVAELKDIDFLKDITLDPKIDIDVQAIGQLAQGMSSEMVINLYEKNKPLAEAVGGEMNRQAQSPDATDEVKSKVVPLADQGWFKKIQQDQETGGGESGGELGGIKI